MNDQTNLDFAIDHASGIPLGQQLYTELYRRIVSGELPEGVRLPPSRELATSLGVARATVTSIYDQLRSEGYLIGEGRRGTIVAKSGHGQPTHIVRGTPALSDFAQALLTQPMFDPTEIEAKFPLYNWKLSHEDLPVRQLQTTFNRIMNARPRHIFEYPRDTHGLVDLRESIAEYLRMNKAISVDPDQVLIVSGWQQALDLIVRLNIPRGSRVAMENPSYPTVMHTFIAAGAEVIPVDVDEEGLRVDELAGVTACAVYVSPSHQFPTGAVMSVQRRNQLLAWAMQNNAVIIEEEHDSDFRYNAHPVPSLKALDRSGNVLYQANFAKTIFPGLSLGYLLVPEQLIDLYRRARTLVQEPVSLPVQQMIADFIASGDYERHVKRMRGIYGERRIAMINALQKYLPNRVDVFGDSAGKHVFVRFRSRQTTKRIVAAALEVGVGLQPSKPYYLSGAAPECEFLLGYGGLTPKQIDVAISRLAKILKT